MRVRTVALFCVAALVACTERDIPGERAEFDQRVGDGYNGAPAQDRSSVALLRPARSALFAGSEELPPIAATDIVTNMVIRTARASIEVDSLELAVARMQQLAGSVGGYVSSTAIETGKTKVRSATLEVKMPAPRFDEGMAGLDPIGKLESVSVNAEDVGEQFVDVTARMENAQRLERRLLDLLANRTGKLKEVLDVEQALARVREEIERHEGRVRYLRAHTATSTLTVYLHEPVPIVGTAGTNVMSEAVRQAWRNFVALAAFGVQSLGIVIPLIALAIVGWFVSHRWRRLSGQRGVTTLGL